MRTAKTMIRLGMDGQAHLHLCCLHMAKTGFLMTWLMFWEIVIGEKLANVQSQVAHFVLYVCLIFRFIFVLLKLIYIQVSVLSLRYYECIE